MNVSNWNFKRCILYCTDIVETFYDLIISSHYVSHAVRGQRDIIVHHSTLN
jgi:hypothetical protein